MGAQTGSPGRLTSRRSAWRLALLLSVGLHLVMLGWLASRRAAIEWRVDPPALSVQLVRPPPPTPAVSKATSKPAGGRSSNASDATDTLAPTPAEGPETGTPASPGVAIDPRWRVDRRGPPPPSGREPDYDAFQPCDPLKDPKRESKACRKVDEIAESVGRFYDPQKGDNAFAREARRNEALKRYRDAPGGAGYPGIACHVLRRC